MSQLVYLLALLAVVEIIEIMVLKIGSWNNHCQKSILYFDKKTYLPGGNTIISVYFQGKIALEIL